MFIHLWVFIFMAAPLRNGKPAGYTRASSYSCPVSINILSGLYTKAATPFNVYKHFNWLYIETNDPLSTFIAKAVSGPRKGHCSAKRIRNTRLFPASR